MLDLSTRAVSPPVVLEVSGDLDIATEGSFETAVVQQLGRSSVIVDFARLDFLAISALRSLVICQRYAAARGRPLVYAAQPRQARRLIELAGLDRVLTQSDSVAAAWAGVTGTARPAGMVHTIELPRQRIVVTPRASAASGCVRVVVDESG